MIDWTNTTFMINRVWWSHRMRKRFCYLLAFARVLFVVLTQQYPLEWEDLVDSLVGAALIYSSCDWLFFLRVT